MSMLDIEKRLAAQKSLKESTNSVVAENETWTVYKATDEASMKKYGRDTCWAMPRMWDKYTEHGLQAVYIFIKKGEIDRRGKTDKYAVCVFSNGEQEIFDQRDEKVKAIPNSAGISISGVKLGNVVKESKKITKAALKEMIREVLKEELGHDSVTSDTIKKLALYKKVNIIPEQGPRQRYNQKLKITTSWTDFRDTLLAEQEKEMNELVEYSDIPFEELDEYLTPDVGWLGIRPLIDKAASGDYITLLEIDYDDLGVSWSGTTEYYIVIL